VTSSELLIRVFKRLKKFSIIILVFAVIIAMLFAFYAKRTPIIYISKASVFPLNSSSESVSSSSALTQLFLGTEAGKNFTEDASINIIELAQSRTTREAVASIRIPGMGNKMIATLLVEDYNNHRGLFEDKIGMPANEVDLVSLGGRLLQQGLTAAINKNNILILTFAGRDVQLVKAVSYGVVEKISKFYIDLKIEKAKADFDFATLKADSLRQVMNNKDYQLVGIDRKTLFTPDRLEYKLPSENVMSEKQMIHNQYSQAVANQQNAAYKLQKATPLVKILDRPEPPYDVQKKSALVYGFIGAIIGGILMSLVLSLGLIFTYAKGEMQKLVTPQLQA
jgi:hypothetical protein